MQGGHVGDPDPGSLREEDSLPLQPKVAPIFALSFEEPVQLQRGGKEPGQTAVTAKMDLDIRRDHVGMELKGEIKGVEGRGCRAGLLCKPNQAFPLNRKGGPQKTDQIAESAQVERRSLEEMKANEEQLLFASWNDAGAAPNLKRAGVPPKAFQ